MLAVIPLFDRFTALDAVGPFEVLQRVPEVEVVFAAERAGPVRTDNGMLALIADRPLTSVREPDVLVVPGGIGTRPLARDGGALVEWLAQVHPHTSWTTSVCTGSLLLAAAGILHGVDATTHWSARDVLRRLGANAIAERVVERGKIVTAAGVSSGIDMALRLAAQLSDELTAKAIQLAVEYDPQPPYDTGAVEKAGPDVLGRVKELAEANAAANRS